MIKMLRAFCIVCILVILLVFVLITGQSKAPTQKELTEKAIRVQNKQIQNNQGKVETGISIFK